VLTNGANIVGTDIAGIAFPVDVKGGRGGLGATLTVLTTGAQAPMLEMQKEALRARVNATYGYNAIARIRITQTAAAGFAEGKAVFQGKARANQTTAQSGADPEIASAAQRHTARVEDTGLRHALEMLGRNVLTKAKS